MSVTNFANPGSKSSGRSYFHDTSPEMPEACRWDLLLRELGITDVQALSEVKGNGYVAHAIREFAVRERTSGFVPEGILQEARRYLIANKPAFAL